MSTTAIIVASGTGQRAGFDKLLALLHGRPVLEWSIRSFASCSLIQEVIVVTPKERFEQLHLEDVSMPIKRVDGGDQRHHSVFAGLQSVDSDSTTVLVHDGARPLIRPSEICRLIEATQGAQGAPAVSLAHPITDTLKRCNNELGVLEGVDRSNLWAMETPQAFHLSLLQSAYLKVLSAGISVTDEVSALELMGQQTTLLHSRHPNIKITFPGDLALAHKLSESP